MSRNLLNSSNEIYIPTINTTYNASSATSTPTTVASVNNNNVAITGGRISNVFMDKIKTFNITDNKSTPIGIEIKNSYGSNMWGIKTSNNQLYFRNEDYINNKEIMTLDISRKVGIGTTTPKNSLDVNNNMAIGTTYAGSRVAPVDSLIIEGQLGVGVITPLNKVDIAGGLVVGSTYAGNKKAPKEGLLVQGNAELSGVLQVGGIISAGDDFSVGPAKASTFYVKALSGDTSISGILKVKKDLELYGDLIIGTLGNSFFTVDSLTGNTIIHGTLNSYKNFTVGLPNLTKFLVNYDTGNTFINGTLNVINDFTIGKVGLSKFEVSALTGDTVISGNLTVLNKLTLDSGGNTTITGNLVVNNTISSSQSTLNITSDIINIGSITSSVNIFGDLTYIEATNLVVTDKNIIINKNGLANSAVDAGIFIEENGIYTSYIKVSSDRNNFLVKAPNNSEYYMVVQNLNYDFSANIITSNELISNKLSISSGIKGIDIEYNNIYATGTQANENISIMPLGSGNVGIATSNPLYKLDVSGNTRITGDTTIGGSLYLTGNSTISNNTNISGNTTISGELSVTSFSTLSNNTTISGALSVTGVSTLSNNTTISGALSVTGVSSLSNNTTVSGALSVTGVSTLSNNTTVSGALTVSGNTTFTNTNTQINSTGIIGLNGNNIDISGNNIEITANPIVSNSGANTYTVSTITNTRISNLYGGIAVHSSGDMYFCDNNSSQIYKVTAAGVMSIFINSGLYDPHGILIINNTLYVCDTRNYRIVSISLSGTITVIAGGTNGINNGNSTSAQFVGPNEIASDSNGNLYIIDVGENNNDTNYYVLIRKIDTNLNVTTILGGIRFNPFNMFNSIVCDSNNNIYIGDVNSSLLYKLTQGGSYSIIGNNSTGVSGIVGLTIDNNNNLYATNFFSHTIMKITTDTYTVTTIAGNTAGNLNGIGTSALFTYPRAMTYNTQSNALFLIDDGNTQIRKITIGSGSSSTSGGNVDISGNNINLTGLTTITNLEPKLLFKPTNVAWWAIQAGSSGGLNFGTTDGNGVINNNTFSISNGGNVGIGTTNTNVNTKLAINYNGITQNQTVLSLHTSNTPTNDYNMIEAGHGITTNFVLKGNGNVGIGTANPSQMLDINGGRINITHSSITNFDPIISALDPNLNGNWRRIIFGKYDNYKNCGELCYYQHPTDSNSNLFALTFHSMGGIYIRSNGCVGIQTNSPNAPLQFNNDIVFKKLVLFEGYNNNHNFLGFGVDHNTLRYQVNHPNDSHVFYTANGLNTDASTELMRIKGNGNIGIATSNPLTRLQLPSFLSSNLNTNFNINADGWWTSNWGISITNDIENNNIGGGYNSRPALSFGLSTGLYPTAYITSLTPFGFNGWNPIMIDGGKVCFGVNSGGSVGIGTASPNYRLDVNGDINYTGTLYKNGSVVPSSSSNLSTNNIWTGTNRFNNNIVCSGGDGTFGGGAWGLKIIDLYGTYYHTINNYFNELQITAKGDSDYWYGDHYGSGIIGMYAGKSGRLLLIQEASPVLTVNGNMTLNGYIGIGGFNPSYPLHISGGVNKYGVTGYYTNLWPGYVAWSNIDTINPGSIAINCDGGGGYFNGIVIGTQIMHTSDKRIKNNILDINDDYALSILRQIQPKTYEYIDKLENGNNSVIGFIAQEIKAILPKAVSIITKYIPNFYTKCSISQIDTPNILLVSSEIDLSWNPLHDLSGNIYIDNSGNACSDALGNKFFNIKLYDSSNNEIKCKTTTIIDNKNFLIDVSGTRFIDISGNITLKDNYFLYGQEVDDFHTIDKGAIFTVVTAAVQDIDRKQQEDSNKISILEDENKLLKIQVDSQQNQITLLQQQNINLQSQIDTLQAQMNMIISKLGM